MSWKNTWKIAGGITTIEAGIIATGETVQGGQYGEEGIEKSIIAASEIF